jgi:hypothetical protein
MDIFLISNFTFTPIALSQYHISALTLNQIVAITTSIPKRIALLDAHNPYYT